MFLERFITYLQFEKRYSPHTVSAYKADLEQFFAHVNHPEQTITHPNEITHHHIRNWMVDMMDNDITARTVNRKTAVLRKYFKFLLQSDVIDSNPTAKIQTPKTPKKLPVVVETDKLDHLLDTGFDAGFEGTRDKLILEMLFGTGIRLAELVGLKETDINVYEGTIKVLGKRKKERIIPINKELKRVIAEYLELKKSEKFNNNSLTLVVTNKGANAYPKLIYNIVRRYLSEISTQNKRSPHVLRHTFATSLLNKGADLNAIKELLGHANLSATQVYTHNSVERLKSIYKQAHPKA
ncbi:tyrosine-type recombinase/integrase [Mucilaginibacter boryungensis]|uniref:Tyrosine recombinase XerC n=1 Tax=Mucilaginibacter boryungensis TaxID=768480 RepID=A0ABR9XL22_9SPHI|nr:tyrosine-type recombinase/integrase [Mucilaginibacter boryungensis]MBE9667912.1 tyrosine-type recombinase/integrase [Mucilaginibacter boryungensis]